MAKTDPDWLYYFSLPKNLQRQLFSTAEKIIGDPFESTLLLYGKSNKESLGGTAHNYVLQAKSDQDLANKNYQLGQSNLAIDYQTGITAIEHCNIRSNPPNRRGGFRASTSHFDA